MSIRILSAAPTSSLFQFFGRGSWVDCSRTRCGGGSCPREWPCRPGPPRSRSSPTLSHKCEVKIEMAAQYFIRFEICWCTGHQITQKRTRFKSENISYLCCPNLWGGSPVLLQFSLWNHLADLKEKIIIHMKMIVVFMRAMLKIKILSFKSGD